MPLGSGAIAHTSNTLPRRLCCCSCYGNLCKRETDRVRERGRQAGREGVCRRWWIREPHACTNTHAHAHARALTQRRSISEGMQRACLLADLPTSSSALPPHAHHTSNSNAPLSCPTEAELLEWMLDDPTRSAAAEAEGGVAVAVVGGDVLSSPGMPV